SGPAPARIVTSKRMAGDRGPGVRFAMPLKFASTLTIGRLQSVARTRAIFRATIIHDVRNVRADVHLVANIPDTSLAIGAEAGSAKDEASIISVWRHQAWIAVFGSASQAVPGRRLSLRRRVNAAMTNSMSAARPSRCWSETMITHARGDRRVH